MPTTNNSVTKYCNNSPCILSQKTYGGSGDEDGGLTRLNDGNYIEWGSTSSADGDFTNNHGGYDAFLMKLDCRGNILWQKTYGGSGDDDFSTVIQTAKGGFVIMGTTSSNDGDISGNHGGNDVWILKVNATGTITSQHCYGGSGDDVSYDNCLVNDGNNYVFAINSNSNNGDVNSNHGNYDDWVVKINQAGKIVWSKCIGGSNYDYVSGLVKIENNKFIIAGGTLSNDGDVSGNHGGSDYGDGLAVKFNQSGDIIWSKCYGGSKEELTNNIALTSDGNIVLAMTSNSNDDDVSGNHGDYDMWIPKINSSTGKIIWQKCLGSLQVEGALGIMSTHDGGVVALGETSKDFDYQNWDAQAIKLNKNGEGSWTKTFGGSAGEYAFMGVEAKDGSLIIQCNTDSYDGDVTGQHGSGDAWLVKLDKCADIKNDFANANATKKNLATENLQGKIQLTNYPNPFSTSTTISFSLTYSQKVSINIYDINGRLIKTLANTELQQGTHQLTWNAKDEKGKTVNAGIYFLKMQTGSYSETRKLVVVK